jgi:integrase
MKLTKAVADREKYRGDADKGQHCILWDDQVPGFGLRIYPSGKKSFIISYRADGRKRRMVIGRYGILTVQEARERARKLLVRVLDGNDPLAERQRVRENVTLAELWDRYLEEYALPRKKWRTVRDEKGVWRRHLAPNFGQRRLTNITREDVARFHGRLRNSPYAANDAVKLLRRLYNQAAEWSLVAPETNPTRFVKLFKEPRRERYLSTAELARLGRALKEAEQDSEDPFAIAGVRLLIFTGARAGEILRLRWDEVDLEARQLRLRDSKTGPKILELPAPAVAVLVGLQELRHLACPWVFPGRDPSKPRNDYLKGPWKRICRRAKIENCRLHDLRHTYASTAAGSGFTLKMIGELLGHRQTSTTERYSHLSRSPRQEAAESIAASLQAALGEGGGKGEVVPLKEVNRSTGG